MNSLSESCEGHLTRHIPAVQSSWSDEQATRQHARDTKRGKSAQCGYQRAFWAEAMFEEDLKNVREDTQDVVSTKESAEKKFYQRVKHELNVPDLTEQHGQGICNYFYDYQNMFELPFLNDIVVWICIFFTTSSLPKGLFSQIVNFFSIYN